MGYIRIGIEGDGLSSNEFNPGAAALLDNGYIMPGSAKGIDIFEPSSIAFNSKLRQIYFTKPKVLNSEISPGDTLNKHIVLNKDIAYTSEITLHHFDKSFSAEFAALNFTHPQKCQYQCKLEGFDETWYEVPNNFRTVSYSNLKNDTYRLLIKATNNDGKWGDNITPLTINILPPFRETGRFYTLAGIAVLLLFMLIYRLRITYVRNLLLQQNAVKEKRIVELEKENIELEKRTVYTVNRNRVLIDYKNRLPGPANKAKPSVKSSLDLVIDEIEKDIGDDKEWKYPEPRLDKFYNNFVSVLREKHPELTLNETKRFVP